MKKLFIILLALMMVMSVTLVACNKPEEATEQEPEEELYIPGQGNEDSLPKLTIPSSINMDLGDNLTVVPTIKNIIGMPSWTSSDSTIVSVASDGTLTARKIGSATITVTLGQLSATSNVVVAQPTAAPVLSLNRTSVTMANGSTSTVTASVLWKGVAMSDATINWQLVDGERDDVVELVPQQDGSAKFTAKNVGTTSFVAYSTYRNVSVSKVVTFEVLQMSTIFDIGGAKYSEGDYSAIVNTIDHTDSTVVYSNHWNPSLNLFNLVGDEYVREQPELANWTIADNTIVDLETSGEYAGQFIGKKEGETTVSYTYRGTTLTVAISCVRPTFELSVQDNLVIEAVSPDTIAISQALYGTVDKLTFNGSSDFFGSFESGVLTLDASKITKDASKLGQGQFLLESALAKYTFEGTIITKIISSKADLDSIGTVAQIDAKHWGGYFVMDSDISYNGAFTPFVTYGAVSPALGEGFSGIFDGRCHVIDGMQQLTAGGGLFGVMTTGSAVRNVAFTNAQVNASGLISSHGKGEISNVYVKYSAITNGSGNNYAGTVFTCGALAGAKISNVFVDASEVTGLGTSNTKTYILGQASGSANCVTDALVLVRTPSAENIVLGRKHSTDVCVTGSTCDSRGKASADNLAAFTAKVETAFSSWDASIWKLTNGLPTFKALAE